MNQPRLLHCCLAVTLAAGLGCSPGESGDATGSGGRSGTGGVVGSGGAVGSGGSPGPGSGGSPGSGGTVGSGGAPGSGGAVGSGGRAGTGGSTGGAGRGGGGAGTGGAAGRGGAGGGMSGSGGRAGTGGAGGGGTSNLPKFSFFVTSWRRLQQLSGSSSGFGGDLRFGETGEGAGLRGADKICTMIAEMSMPGSGAKQWRAFLSAPTGGANGGPVHAIDRIGEGPWYDRMGRVFSMSKANLLGFRPSDTDPAIKNDFPNEDGIPNHNPEGTGAVDNHDTLTGSDANGRLYPESANFPNPTCDGWTNKTGNAGRPRVGHSWPRSPSSTNTCSTMGGGMPGGGAGLGMGGSDGCYGHWMSSLSEAGCAPGATLEERGGPILSNPTVGSGGGYGGWYCFALAP